MSAGLCAPESWEDVLAAVEADVDRSAALVASSAEPGAPLDPAGSDPLVLVLPPLAAMPPVPEYLRERVERLRNRIRELEAELAATLRDWQVPPRPAPLVAVAAPRFLDRRV